MRVRYLSLTNFRNYARLELALPQRPILLCGANAQGKTSLLEAIYLLATGSSPLTSVDRELISWAADREPLPYSRLRAEVVHRDAVREIEVVLEKQPLSDGSFRLQKTIRVDRVRKRRTDLARLLNAVLFMPQDVELISGPPAGRRRYLDDTLCQVSSPYAESLNAYSTALRQRNATLRHLADRGGDPAQLAPFEEVLACQGVRIIRWRQELVEALSRHADRIHQQLTNMAEWLRIDYAPSFDLGAPPALRYQMSLELPSFESPEPGFDEASLVQALTQMLASHRRREIGRGITMIGPHRDNLQFIAGNPLEGTHEVDLGTYGSRGQQRTAVLSLKLAELAWMREQTGETPVFLLDEVLAELDATRRRFLLAQVDTVEQALLTATDPEMFSAEFRQRAAIWEVRGGLIATQ